MADNLSDQFMVPDGSNNQSKEADLVYSLNNQSKEADLVYSLNNQSKEADVSINHLEVTDGSDELSKKMVNPPITVKPIKKFSLKKSKDIYKQNGDSTTILDEFMEGIPRYQLGGFTKEVALILLGLDMKQYIPLFIKDNIGLDTLHACNEEDLMRLGIENKAHVQQIVEGTKHYRHRVKKFPVDYEIIVPPNHSEDEAIVTNVSKQISLLNQYLLLQHKKFTEDKFQDYFVDCDHTANYVMKMLVDKCWQQNELIKKACEDVIGTALKVEELNLPPFIAKKIANLKEHNKRRESRFKIKQIWVPIGFLSLFVGVFVGRKYLKGKWF